ncbi:MAG: pyridoxamine kinase [Lachnospiraceae bacterium]|nr:pyridoxamine kinase [Lachnospiraceae bacterium]MCR5087391.1 pyridoxamine kinase [Lachnospiraceae bacterium]
MAYKKVLTIQDISCIGQCSMTVALPILSASGTETCILPSAVLSNHTAGFSGFTFRDLSEDMPGISAQWKKDRIHFDAVYTGYLGSIEQIGYVRNIIKTHCKGPVIVDPAMADNGKLYVGFDAAYAEEMAKLCCEADITLPNITEACLMTGTEYRTSYDRDYIESLLAKLRERGAKTIVMTGVSYREGRTGVVVNVNGVSTYYEHRKFETGCHGTGDVYASAFVGALMQGFNEQEAARIAADFTLLCIEKTVGDESHWYGVKFELALPAYIRMLGLS